MKILIAAALAAGLGAFNFGPGVAPAAAQSVAPGQARADYHAWLARAPEHRDAVVSFRTFLADKGVETVVPTYQLVRTSASWKACDAARFEVAPVAQWSNIVETLRFVKNEVTPAIGAVEALSVYRNEKLNTCSNGAKASAHRHFFALDLVPAGEVDRNAMIRDLCAAHARSGRTYDAGLGFYSRTRFHVDTSGYRKWGTDGRGASSPCLRVS